MTKRRAFWSLTLLFVVAALAVLLPSSPAYAPKLIARYTNFYEGHGSGYWTRALKDPDTEVRRKAIFALGVLGSDSVDAVPALGAIMVEDADFTLRIEASLALSKMGRHSRSAVPALARALTDEAPLVRMNAARTLLNLGGDAREAIPALLGAIKAPENEGNLVPFDISIQEVMIVALGRASVGTDEGVPTLTETLEGAQTPRVRRATARALGEVGVNARPAAPQLRVLLDDGDPLVRDTAAAALEKIGEKPLPPAPG